MQKNHLDLPETDEEFTQWILEWTGRDFSKAWLIEHHMDPMPRAELRAWVRQCETERSDKVTRRSVGLDIDEISVHGIVVMYDLGE